MRVAPSSLNPEATYKLLSGIVVPRPIAWVSTRSVDGIDNLAPFSCFTFVSNKPPMVGINIGRKAGLHKDTGANIKDTKVFAVNIPDDTMTEAVHHSAVEHPADVSEIDLLGLRTEESRTIDVPKLADVPVSMECTLHSVTQYGETGAEFVVGEIVSFDIRDGLLVDGKIDTTAMRPIARIGGPNYATLGAITTLRTIGQTPKSTIAG